MYSEIYKNAVYKDNKTVFRGFTVTCPLCGREFGCNKTHHVYTALVGRNGSITAVIPVINKGLILKKRDEREVKEDE
jgi:hypothetical protein